ncbi:ATP-binding cassette domain-containing protein [Mitsuaria sp. WAJ17]|uniref:ATP-binding cassette domain-containing protein n=1 Tax=Mitsuaria sp. WAJ17 TaxID=2761452 RepID=UPI0016014DE8|nr:ATP-binding cassette domain-containing protein [Mitsuaria sp. WAJ17]MBB2485712.1 ATP-binding cassette domain-containing protein [Mitsuaria sp. WAJ17]
MTENDHRHPAPGLTPRLRARGLGWHPPGAPGAGSPSRLLAGLDFELGPGLHLVQGGEGRGKTALLHLLAGPLQPDAGHLDRQLASLAWPNPLDPACDAQEAADWLAQERARHADWNADVVAALQDAWQLGPHIAKQMHMLSAGSRRKLGLLAAAASGAALVLLDMPFAALDGRSRRVLLDVLAEAAAQPRQIWVMADYAAPAGLDASLFASRIELGD